MKSKLALLMVIAGASAFAQTRSRSKSAVTARAIMRPRRYTIARLSPMCTGPTVRPGAAPAIGVKILRGSTNEPNGMACITIRSTSDTSTGIARNCANTKPRSGGNSDTSSGTSETETTTLGMGKHMGRRATDGVTNG